MTVPYSWKIRRATCSVEARIYETILHLGMSWLLERILAAEYRIVSIPDLTRSGPNRIISQEWYEGMVALVPQDVIFPRLPEWKKTPDGGIEFALGDGSFHTITSQAMGPSPLEPALSLLPYIAQVFVSEVWENPDSLAQVLWAFGWRVIGFTSSGPEEPIHLYMAHGKTTWDVNVGGFSRKNDVVAEIGLPYCHFTFAALSDLEAMTLQEKEVS